MTVGVLSEAVLPWQTDSESIKMAYEVRCDRVKVWSEGSRIAAEVFRPVGLTKQAPAILICQGWGGQMKDSESYGAKFAGEGFICMTFDYRTWGASDGKIIPYDDTPALTEVGETTIRVRIIREVVDPLDQIADVRAVLAYLSTEDGVDPERMGIWGTSYGCGHVVFTAGIDERIKAVVAQVGVYGHPLDAPYIAMGRQRMAEKARGLLDPPIPQGGLDQPAPALAGTPDMARLVGHQPLDTAIRIRVPTLFIDADLEEYGAPNMKGAAAYEAVRQNTISERRTLPCTHYEIYEKFFDQGSEMAVDWFNAHL